MTQHSDLVRRLRERIADPCTLYSDGCLMREAADALVQQPDGEQPAVQEAQGWILTKLVPEWDKEGTAHTGATVERVRKTFDEQEAIWLVRDSGYTCTPLQGARKEKDK